MKKFFDVECTDPDKLIESFKSFGPTTVVTTGHYEVGAECDARDLDWNHMDQYHRTYVHSLYGETVRVARGSNFALTLTKIRILGIPILMLITDIKLKPGLFYQTFNLFNLINVHIVVKSIDQTGSAGTRALRTVDWYIVSHALFGFLHPLISRKLRKINEIQNPEDFPLQKQRVLLRSKGYQFETDDPDFLNANILKPGLIYPKIDQPISIDLSPLKHLPGKHRVSAGPIDFLIEFQTAEGLLVWLADCPHEGAPMEGSVQCGDQIQCPWHGLRFSPIQLSTYHKSDYLSSFNLTWDGIRLVVTQSPSN